MTHPFERVPAARRRTVMIVLLLATAVAMAVLGAIDRMLPRGIVSFELCAFSGSCDAVLAAYRPVGLEAGFSLGFDYLFMPLYAASLAAAVVFLAAPRSARVRAAAGAIAWGATIAAGLDAIENAALFTMLATGSAGGGWLAGIAAAAKFALVAAALLAVPAIASRPKSAA